MPEISRDEAIQRLLREVQTMPPDELAEAYNELFPSQPMTEDQARLNGGRLRDRITDHINRGIHSEEIVSLWNVVFPKDRHVSYDDDADTLHYGQAPESVQYAD
jgi:hypothetical protein